MPLTSCWRVGSGTDWNKRRTCVYAHLLRGRLEERRENAAREDARCIFAALGALTAPRMRIHACPPPASNTVPHAAYQLLASGIRNGLEQEAHMRVCAFAPRSPRRTQGKCSSRRREVHFRCSRRPDCSANAHTRMPAPCVQHGAACRLPAAGEWDPERIGTRGAHACMRICSAVASKNAGKMQLAKTRGAFSLLSAP